MEIAIIQNKIYEIRGQKIMLDFDLAEMYEVETRVLNQAVKRNINRFPKDFMFQLTKDEWVFLRSQIVILEKGRGKYPKYLPFAFTEPWSNNVAAVLKSDKAVAMNIAIVKAFIALRQFALNYKELAAQIMELKHTVGNHDKQLNKIYEALENLLDDKTDKQIHKKMWENRERIGFRSTKKN